MALSIERGACFAFVRNFLRLWMGFLGEEGGEGIVRFLAFSDGDGCCEFAFRGFLLLLLSLLFLLRWTRIGIFGVFCIEVKLRRVFQITIPDMNYDVHCCISNHVLRIQSISRIHGIELTSLHYDYCESSSPKRDQRRQKTRLSSIIRYAVRCRTMSKYPSELCLHHQPHFIGQGKYRIQMSWMEYHTTPLTFTNDSHGPKEVLQVRRQSPFIEGLHPRTGNPI